MSRFWLAAGAVLATWAIAELAFQAIGFDFGFPERAHERLPVFYRQPTLPTGEAYYRRPGPAVWRGDPLRSFMQQANVPEALLPHEHQIEVRYDAQGFRNPPELRDWQVVVVGDSFVELLGHLPESELFTSGLAERLAAPVRNLGCSWTGPLSHAHYLAEFGGAPSLRHAVLAFFEGNDLQDLARERADLARARARGGERPASRFDELPPQPSLTVALLRLAMTQLAARPLPLPNAEYAGATGRIPASVVYAPPAEVPPALRPALAGAFAEFASTAEALGAKAWLLYVPTKYRALYDRLTLLPGAPAPLQGWRPNGLPEDVAAMAQRAGLTVIDATPPLAAAANRGELPYSAFFDDHLNARGAAIVAETLAGRIGR